MNMSRIVFLTDVSTYIGEKIDDYTKNKLLKNPWTPINDYEFPFSTRITNDKEKKSFGKTIWKLIKNGLFYQRLRVKENRERLMSIVKTLIFLDK